MDKWWGALASALPAIVGLAVRFTSDGRDGARARRIKRYAEMLEILPGSAQPPLASWLESEVKTYADNQALLTNRKLDGGAVGVVLFVAVLTTLGTWFGISLVTKTNWHGVVDAIVWLITGMWAFLGVVAILVGTRQLYKPRTDETTEAGRAPT